MQAVTLPLLYQIISSGAMTICIVNAIYSNTTAARATMRSMQKRRGQTTMALFQCLMGLFMAVINCNSVILSASQHYMEWAGLY